MGYKYIVESEPAQVYKYPDGTERHWGPVYRNAKYPTPESEPKPTFATLYELFDQSVEKFKNNKCLSFRPGKYPEANPY